MKSPITCKRITSDKEGALKKITSRQVHGTFRLCMMKARKVGSLDHEASRTVKH